MKAHIERTINALSSDTYEFTKKIVGTEHDLTNSQKKLRTVEESIGQLEISVNQVSRSVKVLETAPAAAYVLEQEIAIPDPAGTDHPDSNPPINYNKKIYDTHGAISTGSDWSFKAPVPGIYQVRASLGYQSNATGWGDLNLFKNGEPYALLDKFDAPRA